MGLEPSHGDGIAGYRVGTGKIYHYPGGASFDHHYFRKFTVFGKSNNQPIVSAKKIPVVLKPTIDR